MYSAIHVCSRVCCCKAKHVYIDVCIHTESGGIPVYVCVICVYMHIYMMHILHCNYTYYIVTTLYEYIPVGMYVFCTCICMSVSLDPQARNCNSVKCSHPEVGPRIGALDCTLYTYSLHCSSFSGETNCIARIL